MNIDSYTVLKKAPFSNDTTNNKHSRTPITSTNNSKSDQNRHKLLHSKFLLPLVYSQLHDRRIGIPFLPHQILDPVTKHIKHVNTVCYTLQMNIIIPKLPRPFLCLYGGSISKKKIFPSNTL